LLEYELDNKDLADSLYEKSSYHGLKFQRIPLKQSTSLMDIIPGNRWRVAVNINIERDEI
jgi:hypothetical protein